MSPIADAPRLRRQARGLFFVAAPVLAGLAVFASGCGMGLMHTARPTRAGTVELGVSQGFLYNRLIEARGLVPEHFPPGISARYGVGARWDVGLSVFWAGGGFVDGMVNLLPPSDPLALSLDIGAGYARVVTTGNNGRDADLVHVPLRVLASYDALPWLTPYASLGYGFFWVFGYGSREPGVRYAARAGYGDGLLLVTAGLQLFTNAPVRLLLEYELWLPTVDDPGDFHTFVTNHLMNLGLRF